MSFPVSQVHNVGSHTGNDSWAWDFRMPEGTPVVAALDGVVRLARGDSDEGGCDPAMARKANYVVIESAGALETQYLHFSAVRVAPGQHVRRGELLGYSGKTGWACGAHLHFKVATPVSAGWNNPSVEARLQGYGDPSLEAWVSSPPCTAGDVQPAALSAAGSAGQAAISVSLPPPLETQPTAPGSSSSPPLQHPLSTGGAPFPPSISPAPVAGPLGSELQATSPAPAHALARTPPPPSPAAVGQGDTEAELLGAAGSAPARR